MKRLASLMSVLLLFLVIPASLALAAPSRDTVVASGETIENDVTLLDENLEVAAGATINGNVVIINGNAQVSGTINGDIVLFDGDLEATETAVINGECVLFNGQLLDATAAGLTCTSTDELSKLTQAVIGFVDKDVTGDSVPDPAAPPFPPAEPQRDGRSAGRSFWGEVAAAAMKSLLFGGLAFLVASFLPTQLQQMQTTMQQKPVASGTVGVLTAVAVPSLIVLLSLISLPLVLLCGIGLLGYALVLVLGLGLVVAMLLGWIATGNLIGQRLADPLRLKQRTLPMTAAVGTLILTLGSGLLHAILPPAGLVILLVTAVGMGAATLTQFGRRPYPFVPAPVEVIYEDPIKINTVLDTLPPEK